MTNFTVFHCPLCFLTDMLWCSLMIFILNLSPLGTYTFLFLYIIPSTSIYSLSLNIFTSVYFVSLTTFTTLLSITFNYFISSNKSTLSMIIFIFFVLFTSSHSNFINILFSLFLFTSTF